MAAQGWEEREGERGEEIRQNEVRVRRPDPQTNSCYPSVLWLGDVVNGAELLPMPILTTLVKGLVFVHSAVERLYGGTGTSASDSLGFKSWLSHLHYDPVVIYLSLLILSILRDKPEKIMPLTGDTV